MMTRALHLLPVIIATAAGMLASSPAHAAEIVSPPAGWIELCTVNPSFCERHRATSTPLANMNLIAAVNSRVNSQIEAEPLETDQQLRDQMNKVVFLDIDGPMIPSGMFLLNRNASYGRHFGEVPLAVIRRLCAETGAKIVCNTTHSRTIDGEPTIKDALIAKGIPADHFHPDSFTEYPDKRRKQAVDDWLARHPEVTHWVALDDQKFTDDERLVHIDPDAGLHVGYLNQAIGLLGGNPFIVLI